MYFCMLIFISTFTAATAGQVLVLNHNSRPPLITAQGTGALDLVLKEAFRRIGIEVKLIQVPAERALLNANEGIDDGICIRIAGMEKKYPNLVMVPERIAEYKFAVFTRDRSLRIVGWESLKPYSVGIITGWKILEDNVLGTRSLTKVSDADALFELLDHERVDLVVYDRMQGDALVKSQGLVGVKAINPLLARKDVFLYLNNKHTGIVHDLARELRDMKRDGTYQQMVDSALRGT
jgi:polar amino acid transport system substrate-binding protein